MKIGKEESVLRKTEFPDNAMHCSLNAQSWKQDLCNIETLILSGI